ncbi:MAG: N-acetylmuramoyl-L-alanine amidase [Verrucomicrobiota bacterium]
MKKLFPQTSLLRLLVLPLLLLTLSSGKGALLSPLAPQPDWKDLSRYSGTITAAEFERLLRQVYVPDGSWRQWISLTPSQAMITPHAGATPVILPLAPPGSAAKITPRFWKERGQRSPQPGKPLAGLRIAIDPGHLGGNFARMEARWFQIGHSRPVEEGEMTLIVAKILKKKLEAMGAEVWLTRSKNGATTSLRPDKLKKAAAGSLKEQGAPLSSTRLEFEAERLFYRVGEIHNRARLVNSVIRPDLVVCLHFNAEEWGNPARPTLTDKNHLHLLLSGDMSGNELLHEDERYTMLVKLLGGTHNEELGASESVARSLATATGLPPFTYHSTNAIPASSNPYLWVRNLLANRLFECPVVYCEPYVMNSKPVFNRVQFGDYEGRRNVGGLSLPSIYREYADAVAQGLADYYGGAAN